MPFVPMPSSEPLRSTPETQSTPHEGDITLHPVDPPNAQLPVEKSKSATKLISHGYRFMLVAVLLTGALMTLHFAPLPPRSSLFAGITLIAHGFAWFLSGYAFEIGRAGARKLNQQPLTGSSEGRLLLLRRNTITLLASVGVILLNAAMVLASTLSR